MGKDMPPEVIAALADLYQRCGYVRWPSADRRAETPLYKKGFELRLVAGSVAELKAMRLLLKAAGFKPARPFLRAGLWRQPMYGRLAVTQFLLLIGMYPSPDSVAEPGPAGQNPFPGE